MDEIQKVLVKAGRKDLAQKYYKKVSSTDALKRLVSKVLNASSDKPLAKAIRYTLFDLNDDKVLYTFVKRLEIEMPELRKEIAQADTQTGK